MARNMDKNIAPLSGEDDELYPEVQMEIEQEAYRSFLNAAEHGKEGVRHLISTINNLQERMDSYDKD